MRASMRFGMCPALLSGRNLLTTAEVGGFSHLPTVVAWAHLKDEHGKKASHWHPEIFQNCSLWRQAQNCSPMFDFTHLYLPCRLLPGRAGSKICVLCKSYVVFNVKDLLGLCCRGDFYWWIWWTSVLWRHNTCHRNMTKVYESYVRRMWVVYESYVW